MRNQTTFAHGQLKSIVERIGGSKKKKPSPGTSRNLRRSQANGFEPRSYKVISAQKAY
jgi:hypothetical protein